jgi:hypothetical protein
MRATAKEDRCMDTETKSDTKERIICLYPGCEREAVPPPEQVNGRTGPPPRYCDIEEHNASSTFQELKRLQQVGDVGGVEEARKSKRSDA